MYKPRVSVEIEDNMPVFCEKRIELAVFKSVRVSVDGMSFIRSTTFTNLILSFGNSSRRMATAASDSFVGTSPQLAITMSVSPAFLVAAIVAGPVPYPYSLCAVFHGFIHIQVLKVLLLVGDYYVYIVGALKAMVNS